MLSLTLVRLALGKQLLSQAELRHHHNQIKWSRRFQAENARLSRRAETPQEAEAAANRSQRAAQFRLATPRAGIVEFSPGEFAAAAKHLYVDTEHRLIFCSIPKAASTALIRLVYRLRGDKHWRSDPHFRPNAPTLAKWNRQEASKVMNDPNWIKIVFLRDPLVRLLSAYIDKFVERRGFNANYGIKVFGRRLSFRDLVLQVASNNTDRRRPDGLHLGTNPHWKPQRFLCSLEKFAPVFHFVGRYENKREHIEALLRALGLWEDFGASGWAPPNRHNHTVLRDALFDRTAMHRTDADRRYSEFYTGDLEAIARGAYAMDYDLLATLAADDGAPATPGRSLTSVWFPKRQLL